MAQQRLWRKCWLVLSALVLTLEGATPVVAEPIGRCNIGPRKRDPRYERSCAVNQMRALVSQLGSGGDNDFVANAPLSEAERRARRHMDTNFLTIQSGADLDLLSAKRLFSHLRLVRLDAGSKNGTHLKALASNYPRVDTICITQDEPLSDECLESLGRLDKLDGLEIWCPIQSPELLPRYIPKSLTYLQYKGHLILPSLPNLIDLRVNHCKIDATFFGNLDAPRLERLDFSSVDFSPGSLSTISHLKNLKECSLCYCNMDRNELTNLEPLDYLHFSSYVVSEKRHDFWLAKAEAAKEYEDVVFSKRSVSGYLQVARCFVELRERENAMTFWRYAQQTDPKSKELQSVKEQINAPE